jgi:hypothetical protein
MKMIYIAGNLFYTCFKFSDKIWWPWILTHPQQCHTKDENKGNLSGND